MLHCVRTKWRSSCRQSYKDITSFKELAMGVGAPEWGSDGSFCSFLFITLPLLLPPKPGSTPQGRQSEPCNASSFSSLSFVTLLTIIIINSNSEDDYVKSSETGCPLALSGLPVFLQGSPVHGGCIGDTHMPFGCFLMGMLQLPKGSQGESRLGADLVVTTFLPSFLGRTAVYAHYEEEPCREQMTTGEQCLRMRTSEAACTGTLRAVAVITMTEEDLGSTLFGAGKASPRLFLK